MTATEKREIAATFAKTMRCNCDLDNWQPTVQTGHTWVCRIHKATESVARGDIKDPRKEATNDR